MEIKALYLYLTWRCNLSCLHCWVSANEGNCKEELSFEVYKRVMKDAHDLGVSFIKISGGEPLLCWNLLTKVIRYAKEIECDVMLETNGTLLDEEKINFLKQYDCIVSVSLDGNEEKHNYMRNNNMAFQSTTKGIKELIANDVIPQIVYSFSKPNCDDISEVIDYLAEWGIKELKLNPIMRVGRGKRFACSKDYQNVMTVLSNDLLKIRNKFCVKSQKGVKVRMMLPMCFDGYSILLDKNYNFTSCQCEKVVSVLPNGDVGLCGESKDIKEFLYGNIKEKALCDILNTSTNYMKLKNIETKLGGICKECVFNSYCKGSCRVAAYHYGGNIYAPNPMCEELNKMGCFPLGRVKDEQKSKMGI